MIALLLVIFALSGPPVPVPVAPLPGAVIEQNTADCAGYIVRFEWSVPEPLAIFEYQIKVLGPGAREYAVDSLVPGRSYVWKNCEAAVADQNLSGWTWRVRARDRLRQWSFWMPPVAFRFAGARR